jgi:hypothetical protein
MAMLLAATAGCWEVVEYEPPPAAANSANGGEGGSNGSETNGETTPDGTGGDPGETDIFGGGDPLAAGDDEPPMETIVIEPRPAATPAETARTITPAERRQAWTAASGWALAAAVHGMGLPAENVQVAETFFEKALAAAAALGIELPPLPAVPAEATPAERQAAVATALREGAGVDLVETIGGRLDEQARAAAQLAVTLYLTHVSYDKGASNLPELTATIRNAAETAQLPSELCQDVVEALQRRADGEKDVFPAIYALHTRVTAFYAAPPDGEGTD